MDQASVTFDPLNFSIPPVQPNLREIFLFHDGLEHPHNVEMSS